MGKRPRKLNPGPGPGPQQELDFHAVIDTGGEAFVHVHSHGMEKHGKLNYYMANVPTVLWKSGVAFVSNICQAVLKGDSFQDGEKYKSDDFGAWEIKKVSVIVDVDGEPFDLLQIVPLPMPCCTVCEKERRERGAKQFNWKCRVCGCTETTPCTNPANGFPCHWAAPNLCSACVNETAGNN
jgi:hypothetical protein